MNEAIDAGTQQEMRGLLMGFVVSRALQVAAELGLADALAEGPKHRDVLALDVGAHPGTLGRLLRLLVSFGVFDQLADGRVANSARSESLRADASGSMRGLARMYADKAMWSAWGGLEYSVRTGLPSFNHVHGTPMFDYLAAHADVAQRFDEAMVSASRIMNDAIVDAYRFSDFDTLVDVAGGAGSTLAAILRANSNLHGVLFDLPHVTERGREHLMEQGVADRCRIEAGSFFDAIPAGSDGYFMKHILHDWDDDDCLRILANCRAAMSAKAKLLVCEKVMPDGNERSVAKTMDLVMLVLTDGGRERTATQFADLFSRADLKLVRIVSTRSDNSILEVIK